MVRLCPPSPKKHHTDEMHSAFDACVYQAEFEPPCPSVGFKGPGLGATSRGRRPPLLVVVRRPPARQLLREGGQPVILRVRGKQSSPSSEGGGISPRHLSGPFPHFRRVPLQPQRERGQVHGAPTEPPHKKHQPVCPPREGGGLPQRSSCPAPALSRRPGAAHSLPPDPATQRDWPLR